MDFKYGNSCELLLADRSVPCRFCFEDTAKFFRNYISERVSADDRTVVQVNRQAFLDWQTAGNEIDAFAEFCLLCQPVSEALLHSESCVFHAAAVTYRNDAWLIAGSSGVGKSTQCRNLFSLDPGHIAVINGDKPVLSKETDGSLVVHPSPWNGKEGWHGAPSSKAKGIVFLKRGEENKLEQLDEPASVVFAFLSVFQSFRDEEVIRLAAKMADTILRTVPVWQLTSDTVPDSTKLLLELMRKECDQDEL